MFVHTKTTKSAQTAYIIFLAAKSFEKNALHIVNHLICFPVGSVSLTVFYAYAHKASNLRIIAFEKASVVSYWRASVF